MKWTWLLALFGQFFGWVLLEIYSWWRHDKSMPTVSDLLVEYFSRWKLNLLTELAAIALMLHWEIVRRQRLEGTQVNACRRLAGCGEHSDAVRHRRREGDA